MNGRMRWGGRLMWAGALLVVGCWLAVVGCSAKDHAKALGKLEDACKIYLVAEGLGDAMEATDYIKRDDLKRDVEQGRRSLRSACYMLAKIKAQEEAQAAEIAARLIAEKKASQSLD